MITQIREGFEKNNYKNEKETILYNLELCDDPNTKEQKKESEKLGPCKDNKNCCP